MAASQRWVPLSRQAVAADISLEMIRTWPAERAHGGRAAAGEVPPGWATQSDEVLLNQGRASAATGRALATRLVPTLPGLAGRLASPGSRVLDVGTGVAALALALARELPHTHVTAIDVLDRALRLAHTELAQAGPVAGRVELRRQDVADLREPERYNLIWLPAPSFRRRR